MSDDELGHQKFPFQPYAYLPSDNGDHVSLDGTRLPRVVGNHKDNATAYESDINEDNYQLIYDHIMPIFMLELYSKPCKYHKDLYVNTIFNRMQSNKRKNDKNNDNNNNNNNNNHNNDDNNNVV